MTGRDFDTTATAVATQSFTERLGRGEARKDETAPAEEPSAGNAPYRAYGYLPAGTFNGTCDLASWIEGTDIPEGIEFQYRFMTIAGYVSHTQLRIMLPECLVLIEGQMLRDLRRKLGRNQVTFIQQYSAKVWPDPKPVGVPIVEKITVVWAGSKGDISR